MEKDAKAMPRRTESALKRSLSNYKVQRIITTIIFMFVPLLLLIVLTYIPATNMFIYSFQERTQFSKNASFVGFNNYVTVFTQPEYFKPLLNSIYYLVGSFIQLALALLLASIVCSKVKLANVFKGFIFFPYMINGVAIALIFVRFFQLGDGFITTDGALNSIIKLLGGEGVKFLSTPLSANISLVFVSIWRYIGFDFVMFMGAIQSIPLDLYEAADLDGANSWQRFRYIVFPSIRPIIGLQMILAIKGAISVFEIPYIMTGGKFGTSTFVIQTIETAFKYNKVGLASAMAVILLIIIIIVTVIQKLIFREET